jgi:LPXTG-motif cell wall-anchored protein
VERRRQVAVLVLAAIGIAFAVANLDEVKVNWVVTDSTTPLIVVIAGSMVIGAALVLLARRRRG